MRKSSPLTEFVFRSKEEINGWPLVHINIGTDPETGRPLVAKGLVAIGNVAYGLVSIGAVAFGLVTLAGIGLGLVSLGGIAVGLIALGAVALGYEFAFGAAVLSATSAIGAVDLGFQFGLWSLLFAAFVALVIWGLGKARAVGP